MKHIVLLSFFIISFFCLSNVKCTKDLLTPQGEAVSPLTPLNKFDKYFLRMYNKSKRLQQNESTFINGINMKSTVFVLYFFAKWCHACKMQGGEMEKLEKYYGKRIYVVKIDIDQNDSMARKFSIKSLPTIVVMKNKSVLARKEHYVTSNDLITLIRKHL
ncbi:thioredoxin 2 [Plasmodium brasilianum]|uniref:Thioredoxin 2 n=2 Tax=Plasmodium (Plasmodium) TaxID=418103 RepID=A0A1C3L0B1_PLAMA|nr:thioredoxin 2, putative [Plasmodium malariae]KAI4836345.1 thioredoxin 2 [Plasmodium brasilianum]SBT79975.1 thioredoxin 2, putative [Plasmodium malariae]SCO93610.1 thioredoxin 2, putative [Plasmodium malariae]